MFRSMLSQLIARIPHARAAIFCDHEGESVDWAIAAAQPDGAAPLSDYDVKICGAQMAAALLTLDARGKEENVGGMRGIELRAAEGTLLCQAVQDGYYLVLLLTPRPGNARAAFILSDAAKLFAKEM